ncbi:MAG TPA: cysteine desulfurase CsdA [Bacteroidetes bacterium]|nr:cysteine desulfurase CsdA [Bacteroidota bacterium]
MSGSEHLVSPMISERPCDVHRLRADFPLLHRRVRGKALVYLDNAATSQKPLAVLDALDRYYRMENANIHRGLHYLSEVATKAYEDAREKIRRFIHATDVREIVFVRGATEGINLVAGTYGRKNVKAGDEVLISAMEHHSNIVPWQILCEEKNATLRIIPISDDGELIVEEFEKLISEKTKLVALAHVSNALGTVNPIKEMVAMAHARGVPVLIDGAQALPHLRVDVGELDCDFYVFSSHKMFGPTGIGVLYGKTKLLESMPPYQGGGDMIKSVTFEKTIYNDLPYKFEAGTPNIADGIGFGAAIDYLANLDWDAIQSYERELLLYATETVSNIKGIRIIGTAKEKAGVLSFVHESVHPHDIGTVLDQEGIAIRTGHHCAQPVMQRFNIPATARASFAFYNTREEVDALARGIQKVLEVFC